MPLAVPLGARHLLDHLVTLHAHHRIGVDQLLELLDRGVQRDARPCRHPLAVTGEPRLEVVLARAASRRCVLGPPVRAESSRGHATRVAPVSARGKAAGSLSPALQLPDTLYLQRPDGVNIAYQVVGERPAGPDRQSRLCLAPGSALERSGICPLDPSAVLVLARDPVRQAGTGVVRSHPACSGDRRAGGGHASAAGGGRRASRRRWSGSPRADRQRRYLLRRTRLERGR